MARVLAISSQVARGHVGLSAIVPALQALGHDVTALPTIVLSHHPGHPHAAGERIGAAALARMLDGLDANGWLGDVDAVITGYLPSAEHVAFAAGAIDRVRDRRRDVAVLVDAVLGDVPKGIYIAPEAAAAIRDVLVARADILKGNAFEIGWLAGVEVVDDGAVVAASARLSRPHLLATSVPGSAGRLQNVLVSTSPQAPPVIVPGDVGQRVPKGTGDLLCGLWIGCLLETGAHELIEGAAREHASRDPSARALGVALARAVRLLERIIVASAGHDELRSIVRLASGGAR